MSKLYRCLDTSGETFYSDAPGAFGGNRSTRIYGRLDCPVATAAIERGAYTSNRVFFVAEDDAIAAGYRPCARCLPLSYDQWHARSNVKAASAAVDVALLGRHNPHFSRLRSQSSHDVQNAPDDQFGAGSLGDCKSYALIDASVSRYVEAGIAAATKRAYKAHLNHFRTWGGAVPSSDVEVARYIAEYAQTHQVATLARRVAAISAAHEARGLPNPARSPLMRATLRGIRRERGVSQRQAKPLLRDDLLAVLARFGTSLKDLRDQALLLIGFAGGLRRSELVGLDFLDLERVRQGLVITLRRSKTDQDGLGRKIAIPLGRSKWCPVAALESWLAAAAIMDGPLFRPINRHGQIAATRLSPEAVSLIIRERVGNAGYDPKGFSGHSLRSGFATSAAQLGVSSWRIRQQTGHTSDAMLQRYIRIGELFIDNAAAALF